MSRGRQKGENGHVIAVGAGPQGLAVSVVHVAWLDALHGPGGSEHHEERHEAIQSEARAFLTAAAGAWAEAQVLWCDAAGIDPHALRQRALRVLAAQAIAA